LQSLPGVGRKTANVVLNNAFGQPTIGVDTHVFRVSNRLGIAPGKDVITVEKKLIKNVPDEFLTNIWNNQPTTVMGIGVAIFELLGIYISLLQTYQ